MGNQCDLLRIILAVFRMPEIKIRTQGLFPLAQVLDKFCQFP